MLGKLSYRDHSRLIKQQSAKPSRIWGKTIVLASLAIGCIVPAAIVGLVESQKAALREKAIEAEQQLQTDPVAGLVLAIQATGQNRTRLPWQMLPEVQSSLLSAVQTARERNRFEQSGQVYAATFTPNGQQIATAGAEGNIYLTDLQNAQPQILQGDGQAIGSIQFSPDGTAVLGNPAVEDGMAQFWNLQAEAEYFPPPSYLSAAAFSSDGQMLISGNAGGRVQLWNRQGEWIANLYPRQSDGITAVAFEGSSLVSGSKDGNITLWNPKGEWLGRLWAGAKVTGLSLSHSGQRIISQDLNRQQAFIWDTQANRWNQFLLGETSTVRSATLNPDNTIVARGNQDGRVQLLPLNAQSQRFRPQLFLGHQGAVNTITFSPDGQTVVSGGEDGSVRIWDVWDGTLLAKSHLQEWEENQNLIEVDRHNTVTVPTAIQAFITSTTFSTDGKQIASSDADGTIHLSDAEGNFIGRLSTGHQTPIQFLEFGKNNETIVSVAQDGELRVWQANWQGWLETACNRLQYHPVLNSPSTPEAQAARSTCERYVWSSARKMASEETMTEADQPAATDSIAPETRVVVKLSERKVYVYQGDQIQASYPIATGKAGWETPTGTFRVFEMLQDPAWTHPITRERVEPGAENPLGTRWIAFWSDESNKIGFHGTPDRDSIGQSVSHGCLRMYDEDARALYEQIKLGTLVTVES